MRKLLLIALAITLLIGSTAHAAPSTIYELRIVLSADTDDADLLELARQSVEQRLTGIEVTADVTVSESTIAIVLLGTQDKLLAAAPRMVKLATAAGLLEFVDFSGLPAPIPQPGACVLTTAQLEQYRGAICEGVVNVDQPYATIITGSGLDQAAAIPSTSGTSDWMISFTLQEEASTIFADFTQAHIGEPLAIVLDGEVISAPIVNGRIEGEGVIQGNFTQEEAENLAIQLRYGALPVVLSLVEVQMILWQ